VVASIWSHDHELQGRREAIRLGLSRSNRAALLILLVVVGLASWAVWKSFLATRTAREAETLAAQAENASAPAERELWKSLIAQSEASRLTTKARRRDDALKAIAMAAEIKSSPELRDEAVAALALTGLSDGSPLSDLSFVRLPPALGLKLQRTAVLRDERTVEVFNLATGQSKMVMPLKRQNLMEMRMDPSEQWLALRFYDGTMEVWNLRTQKLQWSKQVRQAWTSQHLINFHRLQSHLSVMLSDQQLGIFEVHDGSLVSRVALPENVSFFIVDRTGARLAAIRGDQCQIWDIRTGRMLREKSFGSLIYSVDWHPDGRRLAIGLGNSQLSLWDSQNDTAWELVGHDTVVSHVRFSPDGDLVMSYSWDSTTLTLRGATHGPNLFVAVGGDNDESLVMTSRDGLVWARQDPGTSNVLHGVTYGAGRFVAVGERGAILSSSDGTNWTRHPTGLNATLRAVASGYQYEISELLVAVGDGGALFTSPDGVAWTYRSSGTLLDLYCVAGVYPTRGDTPAFIAAGPDGIAFVSQLGIAWTAISLPTAGNILAAAGAGGAGNHSGGIYGLVGDEGIFFTSPDSYTSESIYSDWNTPDSATDQELLGLIHIYGGFLAVGRQGTIRAGLTWVRRDSGSTVQLNAATHDGHQWISVGEGGNILTSPDGRTWQTQRSPTTQSLYSIASGGGISVAIGNNMEGATSTNGIDWTGFQLSLVPGSSGAILQRVAYGNGLFVATGNFYQADENKIDQIFWSTNGLNWQVATSFVADFPDPQDLAFGNGTFVLVEGDVCYTSSDGQAWTTNSLGFRAASVTFGNGQFLASGGRFQNSNRVATSRDGRTWHQTIPNVFVPSEDSAYGEGFYIAMGRRNAGDSLLWRSAKLSRVCSDKLSQRLEAEGAASSFQGVD
jgi:WD40 repeat protein